MSDDKKEETRSGPSLTHSQSVNRLQEINAELERLAELNTLTPRMKPSHFEELRDEFFRGRRVPKAAGACCGAGEGSFRSRADRPAGLVAAADRSGSRRGRARIMTVTRSSNRFGGGLPVP